jgi:hypothetical protein
MPQQSFRTWPRGLRFCRDLRRQLDREDNPRQRERLLRRVRDAMVRQVVLTRTIRVNQETYANNLEAALRMLEARRNNREQ